MKKILSALFYVLVFAATANAQSIKVYEDSKVIRQYNMQKHAYEVVYSKDTDANTGQITIKEDGQLKETFTYSTEHAYKVMYCEWKDPLLPGKFTVNKEGKQVKFTKGNLYWNGSVFMFEENQTDYQTTWNANHVSHLNWTKTAADSYALSYYDDTMSTDDVPFFAESQGGLTVEGTSDLFVLSQDEWYYLISCRTNATNLIKYGVSVTNNGNTYPNCLIIAPDGFTGKLHSSYTLADINTLGLVCLPAAGRRVGSSFYEGSSFGYCWSSTPRSDMAYVAYHLDFYYSKVCTIHGSRYYGRSIRLVALPQ